MMELSPGLIAIAGCNGLFRFNIASHRVDTLLQIPGICVRALWKYKGYLFIGTYGRGIYLYKNGVLRHIPADKTGYLQYAHCFVPDKLGYCWISTNKGLFRAQPEDMIDAFENGTATVYYHYYGRSDGLEMTELNGGCTPCALALNDTTLSFPSMDGLAWVDPSHPIPRLPAGELYIDAFSADGHPINSTSLWRPDLPSGTRDLVFSLAYPAWAGKENLYIDYKLEPYVKDWQTLDAGNDPKLNFSNLPSGNYRLLLRLRNGFGKDNYSQLEKSFRIEPRWYQQPWAWLLGLCLLTGSIIGIVWLRTRQFKIRHTRLEYQITEKTRELQAKNEELEKTDHIKTRLISIISHDLVTPLKFLHLTGKSLIEKKDVLPEALQLEAITEITTTAKELELLSTNILNWIKYRNEDRRLAKENFNLHALVSQLFGIFNAMAREKQIRLINEVNKTLTPYQFIEPVKIVLYNLILNGINFTQEGHILVSSSMTPDGIDLVIEDTGVGMTQDQINNIMADHFIISSANVDNRKGNGLGYLIIKDLLKIIRGQLTIKSGKGKGTAVAIRIPA
jgi:signal transduction histidine kinase